MSLFIAAEGGEGGGKSVLVARLGALLVAANVPHRLTRQPGATPVGKMLRDLLLEPGSDLDPHAETLLYAADRAQHVARVVRPALAAGMVVVSDRYVDSNLAYQGAGRGQGLETLRRLNRWATGRLVPDLTVVLDIDPVVGLARARQVGRPDRLESAGLAFHQRVRQAFLDLAAAEPHRYLVVDATQAVDRIADVVWARVLELLPVGAGR